MNAVTKARPRNPYGSRLAWVVAGDCAVGALALALVLDGDQRLVMVVSLMVLAVVIGVVDLVRRVTLRAQSGAIGRFARTGILVAIALGAVWVGYGSLGAEVVLVIVALVTGMALMAHWLVGVIEQTTVEPSPWQQLGVAAALPAAVASAAPSPVPGPPPAKGGASIPRWVGGIVGAGLVLFAVFDVVLYSAVQDRLGSSGVRGVVIGLVVFTALSALIAGPLVLAAQAGMRRTRAQRDRARERQAVAAHLHDSVLQTLALIQRSATDPARVVHLARQQERGLRAWLAGRDETAATSLAEAIERVVAEVEAEAGTLVDAVFGGDAPMDPRAAELVAATREALRNAVRHGGGGTVRLFLDVDAAGPVVFVRDDGPGFDPAAVPAERGGVRDAMIGRMERVGGTTQIESGPAGTEVALRLPGRSDTKA